MAGIYGERFAAPDSLSEPVGAGNLEVKSSHGFLDIDPSKTSELLACRDRAYAALNKLRAELEPTPGLAQ